MTEATDTVEITDAEATKVGEAQEAQPAEQQTQTDPAPVTEVKETKSLVAEPEVGESAPETYTTFTMPEGHEPDEAVNAAFVEVARDLNLSQENAQKLVDKMLPTMRERAEAMDAELTAEWQKEVKADKEIGGDKLDENLATARRAIKAHGSDGLQKLLDGPLGNHPEVVRFLVKVGKTVSEDSFVSGEARGSAVDPNDEAAVAKMLYPSTPD